MFRVYTTTESGKKQYIGTFQGQSVEYDTEDYGGLSRPILQSQMRTLTFSESVTDMEAQVKSKIPTEKELNQLTFEDFVTLYDRMTLMLDGIGEITRPESDDK